MTMNFWGTQECNLALKALATLILVMSSSLGFAAEKFSTPNHPQWREECGGCHVPFPPQLLAKDNWRQLMSSLNKHFGSNASLEPDVTKEILDFLESHAGSVFDGHRSESGMHITDTPWFQRRHGLIPNRIWSEPSVKSRANCKACHLAADRGIWSEHDNGLGYCRACHKGTDSNYGAIRK